MNRASDSHSRPRRKIAMTGKLAAAVEQKKTDSAAPNRPFLSQTAHARSVKITDGRLI